MRNMPSVGDFTAGWVEATLEAAGRTLMALPWAGCFPAGERSLWPFPVAGDPGRRYPTPTSAAISDMDLVYGWVALIEQMEERRLVLMRSLVFPDSPPERPRYVFTWHRLRLITGLHSDTLKTRWGRGIDRMVTRLNRPGFCVAAGGKVGPSSRAVEKWMRVTLPA
jgi:hypothetical protein